MTDYFTKLDRYLMPQEQNRFLKGKTTGSEGAPLLAKPIIPISKLGATFGEANAQGMSDILGNMLASIRKGSGVLQLAMSNPVGSQMNAGVASMGKDKRQAVKEILMASGVTWEGLEFSPRDMTNMSGFDTQQGGFSEQKRKQDMQHVKDAIVFAADIGAGGGVDVWSYEFNRGIGDAKFNEKSKTKFIDFDGWKENKNARKVLVDERTGAIVQEFETGQCGGRGMAKIAVPEWKRASENGVGPNGVPYNVNDYLDVDGNKLSEQIGSMEFIMSRVPVWDEKKKEFKSKKMDWNAFKDYAQERNKTEDKNFSPEVWWARVQMENQYAQQRGQSIYYASNYEEEQQELKKMLETQRHYRELEANKGMNELKDLDLLTRNRSGDLIKKSEEHQNMIDQLKMRIMHVHESSGLADAQANTIWDTMQHIKPIEDFAKKKTFDSYADLGINAMETTQRHHVANPVYVGPELGWPTGYGGHPEEFVEIIENSRKQMIEKMKHDTVYRNKFTDKQMQEMAKTHIKGVFDTAHMTMWYNHFPKQDDHESEEHRLNRFNKWFMDQMDYLGKKDVIGSVQVVDSATGDHRHLPVGQGIFPTVDAVKALQKNGYKGPIVSEGHEDEMFEPGSTQYSLWSSFGASMGNGYHFGAPTGGNSFGNIYSGRGGAAGYRAPPNYIFGAYAPSNEWSLWSEIPLE